MTISHVLDVDAGLDTWSDVAQYAIPRVFGLWISYHIARALYNISPMHPLSHIPGPKLAAMSLLYEFWFDFVKFGRYSMEIKRMHQVYGPVVRISPDEVHCDDASMVDEIYAGGGRRREKSAHWCSALTGPVSDAILTTIDHDLHRRRRAAMANAFSRASIARLEPMIQDKVKTLCAKLLRQKPGQPFEVTTAYSCFTTDVITDYCFGEPFGLLDQEGWEPNFCGPTRAMQDAQPMFKFFPVMHLFAGIFPALAKLASDEMAFFIKSITDDMPGRVESAKAAVDAGVVRDRSVVFEEMFRSPALPDHEKTVYKFTGHGMILVSAGTETTAWTLAVLTFHVLTTPSIRQRLEAELAPFGGDGGSGTSDDESNKPLSWQALERLPYLTAVILEALRLSYGIAARLPRVCPDEDLVYRGSGKGGSDIVIPRGYAVGMSTVITHHNEDIFPDSHRFLPERWLDDKDQRKPELEKHMLSFSRGSRVCVGQQLAWCNMYVTAAALILRVFPHMEMFETTLADVEYDHDAFVSRPKMGTKGIRVVMK